jgi:hypothetical protein
MTTTRYVITQKRAVLGYFAVDTEITHGSDLFKGQKISIYNL